MASDRSQLMMTLGQLVPQNFLVAADSQLPIKGITLDSREVQPGYVFAAIKGLKLHGKTFIPQAEAKGAVAILVDAMDKIKDAGVPVIGVTGLDRGLSAIAGRFYANPSQKLPVIGVTGTNGKTTCTQLLAQALAYLHQPCGVVGTLGSGVIKVNGNHLVDSLIDSRMTTPDAINTQAICARLVDSEASFIAIEVSSHAMVQHRVAALAIDTAVFTNLSHDHLDYHGSMAAYGAAKAGLFAMPSLTTAVINQDDDFATALVKSLKPDCKLFTFSINQPQSITPRSCAHFALTDISLNAAGASACLLTPEGSFPITTRLLGRFNLGNLLAVTASLYAHHFSMTDIVCAIAKLAPVSGRMELVPNRLGFQVVVDYAHTPDALKNSLESLLPHCKGQLWCIFGCGGDRDRDKRPQMARIAEQLSDQIVVTNDNPRREPCEQIFSDIKKGFKQSWMVIADRTDAIEFALMKAKAGDVVLIAGKGHEDYQLIGNCRFAFSDRQQARLCLRQREERESVND